MRGYEILEIDMFMSEINALIASDVDLKVVNVSDNYKTSAAINRSTAAITKSAPPSKSKKLSSYPSTSSN